MTPLKNAAEARALLEKAVGDSRAAISHLPDPTDDELRSLATGSLDAQRARSMRQMLFVRPATYARYVDIRTELGLPSLMNRDGESDAQPVPIGENQLFELHAFPLPSTRIMALAAAGESSIVEVCAEGAWKVALLREGEQYGASVQHDGAPVGGVRVVVADTGNGDSDGFERSALTDVSGHATLGNVRDFPDPRANGGYVMFVQADD